MITAELTLLGAIAELKEIIELRKRKRSLFSSSSSPSTITQKCWRERILFHLWVFNRDSEVASLFSEKTKNKNPQRKTKRIRD